MWTSHKPVIFNIGPVSASFCLLSSATLIYYQFVFFFCCIHLFFSLSIVRLVVYKISIHTDILIRFKHIEDYALWTFWIEFIFFWIFFFFVVVPVYLSLSHPPKPNRLFGFKIYIIIFFFMYFTCQNRLVAALCVLYTFSNESLSHISFFCSCKIYNI